MSLISDIATEVESMCADERNKFGYGIWSHHILSVVAYSKQLAEMVGADAEIVEIAALLHDYASIKDYAMYKEHHLHSANEANVLLSGYNYPNEKIEQVKECIRSHRGSVIIEGASIEAICLADANAIAHLVNVPSLLYFAYTKRGLSIDEGVDWVKGKLERSWSKLSVVAQELIEDKYKAAMTMLDA